jgi:gluconate 2-dehydrogenase gamma chain
MGQSRRVFVQRLTFMGGGVVLLGGGAAVVRAKCGSQPEPAAPAPASNRLTFGDPEWAILTAACERVLPKDEDPGALDAHVPDYIDRILQTPELQKMKADFVSGLAALDRRASRMYKKGFAQLAPAEQDELLAIFKDSPEKSGEAKWYELLLVLSLEGFLGDPSYGGNFNHAGWDLVGFKMVGTQASEPAPGYDGVKHLHTAHCGGGKGC